MDICKSSDLEDILNTIKEINAKLDKLIDQQNKMQEDIDYILRYGYRL